MAKPHPSFLERPIPGMAVSLVTPMNAATAEFFRTHVREHGESDRRLPFPLDDRDAVQIINCVLQRRHQSVALGPWRDRWGSISTPMLFRANCRAAT